MSRLEFLSPEGLRVDGRRVSEPRRVACRIGVLARADGSAYLEQGNTKVLATVTGPREAARRSAMHQEKAVIHCEMAVATFSGMERRKRGKRDRRISEMCSQLRQVFESSVQTDLFPRSQIDIHVQVLQTDGGVLPAAINVASLALTDAGIPSSDFVVACSAGFIEKTPFLDINAVEESAGGPYVPVAIHPRSGKVVLSLVDSRMPLEALEPVLCLAVEGCRQIHDTLKLQLHEQAQPMIRSRGVDFAVQ